MKLTPEKLTAFCAALAETCNVGKACAAVGIARQTAYEWRDEIPEFAERWDKALKVGVSALEDEAHRRAFEGVDDPLTHQGQFTYLPPDPDAGEGAKPVIATVKKYSDTLAIFLLKAHDPEKYRDNAKIEMSGHLAVSQLSDDDIKAEIAAAVAAGILPTEGDA